MPWITHSQIPSHCQQCWAGNVLQQLPGPVRKAGVETHLVCLPSATISDKHHPCYGLIVLILQHDPTESTWGHTKAPKTWRSVAFCGDSPDDLKARGLQMLPVPKVLLCLNNSPLSRAMLLPQSIHSSKRIICRWFFLSQNVGGLAGNDQSGSNGWHPQDICSSAEHPTNLLEICAFQTGLPKDPSQPGPWQHCHAQDHLPAFL